MLKLLISLSAICAVIACPSDGLKSLQHENGNFKRNAVSKDWGYDASYNWGMINRNYTTCQTGTTQSPIKLLTSQGVSLNHIPKFNYTAPAEGSLYNWGFGPAFELNHTLHGITASPSLTYDKKTLYLQSWHIHAPSEHVVDGERVRAELHLVHGDAEGHKKAVVGVRINPRNEKSPFWGQFPDLPRFDNSSVIPLKIDMKKVLQEVNMLSKFWTYRGSLTSPPCTEELRWFVAQDVMLVSVQQMQAILAASTYSARVVQSVWQHQINV